MSRGNGLARHFHCNDLFIVEFPLDHEKEKRKKKKMIPVNLNLTVTKEKNIFEGTAFLPLLQ